MQNAPLISVVTPVYNGADYLAALIDSVQAQDYPYIEHIIIDDGSTDDGATVTVLQSYNHLDNLRWWSRENRGQYATQNEAVAAATGDLVVIIAADDVFVTPEAFTQVVAYWLAHPGCDLVYGQVRRMAPDGVWLPDIDLSSPPRLWLLKHIVYTQHCAVFAHRDLMQAHPFDAAYRYTGDWDWLIRVFSAAVQIGYLRQPLAVIRMHPQQTSRLSNPAIRAEERQRIARTYGGSYQLHRLLVTLNNYRAMVILGLHTLRQKGIRAFAAQVLVWLRRRLGR